MRFEVPQFIEIEDKIFGPFTWKQFIYLAGGLGLGVVMFITLPLILFVIIGFPLGGLSALLAFYPVNNRPFADFLEAVVYYYKNHRVYYWRKKSDIVYRDKSARVSVPLAQSFTKEVDIMSLSQKLETPDLQK